MFFTRPSGKGGGIGIFIGDDWMILEVPVYFSHAEALAFELCRAECVVSLLAMYRPPSENVISFSNKLKNNLSLKFFIKCVCMIGDINIDTIKDNALRYATA